MQPGEFFTRVRLRADLENSDDAARVTSCVLGIFGTLDLDGELQTVASQLPEEIEPMLLARAASDTFSASDFASSVAAELNVEAFAAEPAATAVLTTLREALTEDAFLGVDAVLPEDFHRFMTQKRPAHI